MDFPDSKDVKKYSYKFSDNNTNELQITHIGEEKNIYGKVIPDLFLKKSFIKTKDLLIRMNIQLQIEMRKMCISI